MRSGRLGVACGLLLVILAGAPTAWADGAKDRQRATALLREGAALLDRKDYAEALDKFNEAYRLVPSPKIQFNIGLAQQGLARPAEAMGAYRLYIDGAPSDSAARRADAQERLHALRARVTLLQIASDTTGASITVDGADQGRTPLLQPLVLDPGAHQIVVQAPGGGAPWTRAVHAEAGGNIEWQANLQQQQQQQPASATSSRDPAAAPGPAPSLAAAPPVLIGTTLAPDDSGRPMYKRGWFWAVAGGVLAAAVVTTFLLVPRDARHDCAVQPCLGGAP